VTYSSSHPFLLLETHGLHLEKTYFEINKKQLFSIRVGSWNKSTHPPKSPGDTWKEVKQPHVQYKLPKLRVSTIAMCFAVNASSITTLKDYDNATDESTTSSSSDSNKKSSRSSSESDSLSSFNDSDDSDDIDINKQNLPDPNTYPLLACLGIPISDKFTYDALVREILKLNGGKSITHMQGNQTRATLLKISPIKKEENLRETLLTKGSIIDDMISFIGKKCFRQSFLMTPRP
jgi:hypothetical protein